jgi:predicted ABC-type transport system involved in lysophospholipase L1 biosynthesis ATPase subunit
LDLYVRNVAKLDTTKSVISKTTGTVVTGLKENVRGDAAFAIVGSAGSGTVTLSATTAGT